MNYFEQVCNWLCKFQNMYLLNFIPKFLNVLREQLNVNHEANN